MSSKNASNSRLHVVVLPGDGIGQELMPPTTAILGRLAEEADFTLTFDTRADCGAQYYRESGEDCSPATFEAARAADAILLGAMGLPTVRYDSGTEIAPHLRMREEFGLYAIRPVKAFPNTPRRLLDERAIKIDLIVLRESTEGLFYSQGRGEIIGDSEARETLRITRATTEKLVAPGTERAVESAFAKQLLRPMEFGGDQGLKAATAAVLTELGHRPRASP